MVADVRLCCMDADVPNSGWNGEIPIFDMEGFSFRHLTGNFQTIKNLLLYKIHIEIIKIILNFPAVVLSVLRVYMKYTQVS